MFYIIVILTAIFAMPAKALDGTRSPANVPPAIGIPPRNNPNNDFTLQRGAADLMAQANPGGASLKEQLIGAWALVSCKNTVAWCSSPNGIYILDGSGHYATVNAARGRPKFTVTGRAQPRDRDAYSAEEYKAATMGLQAQFGTWSANEADKTIAFHIDGALFPNVEGLNGKFTVSISGDELTLVGGVDGPSVWRRVKN